MTEHFVNFPPRLRAVFKDIRELPCVRDTRTSVSTEDLRRLTQLLNTSIPQTRGEFESASHVRFFSKGDRRNFMKFLRSSPRLKYLVLWTDAATIRTFLHLRGRVYIKWNSNTKSYSCEHDNKYHPSETVEVYDVEPEEHQEDDIQSDHDGNEEQENTTNNT